MRWLVSVFEWLLDRILDGLRSGPHGPAQPQRGLPERDPGSGRWISDPAEAEYEDGDAESLDDGSKFQTSVEKA